MSAILLHLLRLQYGVAWKPGQQATQTCRYIRGQNLHIQRSSPHYKYKHIIPKYNLRAKSCAIPHVFLDKSLTYSRNLQSYMFTCLFPSTLHVNPYMLHVCTYKYIAPIYQYLQYLHTYIFNISVLTHVHYCTPPLYLYLLYTSVHIHLHVSMHALCAVLLSYGNKPSLPRVLLIIPYDSRT